MTLPFVFPDTGTINNASFVKTNFAYLSADPGNKILFTISESGVIDQFLDRFDFVPGGWGVGKGDLRLILGINHTFLYFVTEGRERDGNL